MKCKTLLPQQTDDCCDKTLWDHLEDCAKCNNSGWQYDDLSSAMGGKWWRYCHCKHGERLSKEDDEEHRERERLRKEQSPYKECPTCSGSGKVKKDGNDDVEVQKAPEVPR